MRLLCRQVQGYLTAPDWKKLKGARKDRELPTQTQQRPLQWQARIGMVTIQVLMLVPTLANERAGRSRMRPPAVLIS